MGTGTDLGDRVGQARRLESGERLGCPRGVFDDGDDVVLRVVGAERVAKRFFALVTG